MLWSKTFIPTIKEVPQEAESVSHQLMLRAGLVRMLMAGAYIYLPLGLKVLRNIEKIIRQELAQTGATELLLPALQPRELWLKTGRDKTMGDVMIQFTDRRGRHLCLGPTHEEVITELVKNHVSSYRQLPLVLYQIQTKFRDEIRPRFGVVRACEFVMKDAYSFDKDQEGLERNYARMHEAYRNIFKRCGLDCLSIEADAGVMGGSLSHEFMVPAESGEDIALVCTGCKKAMSFAQVKPLECPHCKQPLEKVNTVEVGHIFQLGTKYSAALGANFLDAQGKLSPIIMGCYGIGVSRLIAAIIEQNHDARGIIWPKEIAPYEVIISVLEAGEGQCIERAQQVYGALNEAGINALMDDRDERAGVKFKDAELIGIPLQVVVGQQAIKQGKIEIKTRKDASTLLVPAEEAVAKIRELLRGEIKS